MKKKEKKLTKLQKKTAEFVSCLVSAVVVAVIIIIIMIIIIIQLQLHHQRLLPTGEVVKKQDNIDISRKNSPGEVMMPSSRCDDCH